jgi:hypothetical protein
MASAARRHVNPVKTKAAIAAFLHPISWLPLLSANGL